MTMPKLSAARECLVDSNPHKLFGSCAEDPQIFPELGGIGSRHMSRRIGIETVYGGVKYRSRHEAAFAAWFDRLGWKFSYEPTDLEYYIPDFDLTFARKPLLVEIKPAQEDMECAKSKIESTSWEGDIAILVNGETKILGEIYEPDNGWDRAVLCFCTKCKKPTLIAESGRWACRNCDGSNRDLWFAYDRADDWKAAKNAVQWKPRKK